MADVGMSDEKGKRAGQRVSKSASQRVSGVKPRKGKVKGYGVDRLRTAAERRMAESSEALAKTLIDNALKGRLESVKVLMKLAEEEKVRRENEREEDTPRLSNLLVGSVEKIGQMWDGHGWRRVAKSRILEEGCAEWEDIVGRHREPVRGDDHFEEDDDLEEAA